MQNVDIGNKIQKIYLEDEIINYFKKVSIAQKMIENLPCTKKTH